MEAYNNTLSPRSDHLCHRMDDTEFNICNEAKPEHFVPSLTAAVSVMEWRWAAEEEEEALHSWLLLSSGKDKYCTRERSILSVV